MMRPTRASSCETSAGASRSASASRLTIEAPAFRAISSAMSSTIASSRGMPVNELGANGTTASSHDMPPRRTRLIASHAMRRTGSGHFVAISRARRSNITRMFSPRVSSGISATRAEPTPAYQYPPISVRPGASRCVSNCRLRIGGNPLRERVSGQPSGSGRRGSNPRRLAWEASTPKTESGLSRVFPE